VIPPRIVLTPGEPAGVGPDICIQLAQRRQPAELVVIADPQLLLQRAEMLGLPLDLVEFSPSRPPQTSRPGRIGLLAEALERPVACGVLDPANAPYVLRTLDRAVSECLHGTFAALVTGPVHKGVINDAGIAFSGHTEFLATACDSFPVMMLAAPGLRVALATTHLPLAAVSGRLSEALLSRVLQTLERDLRLRFLIPKPRILVCGLNPHAGEGGHLGREEIETIGPTLDRLRGLGMCLEGPLPADTVFLPSNRARADAVLAMYHDQGLPVLKCLAFGQAVNITLGLPIIRTSVDHGTALDLAGKGKASIGSLQAAVDSAIGLAGKAQARAGTATE